MRIVIHDLLKQYLMIEQFFQQHQYDKCVQHLKENYKDNMAEVTQAIISHAQCAQKNELITLLIDHVSTQEPGINLFFIIFNI